MEAAPGFEPGITDLQSEDPLPQGTASLELTAKSPDELCHLLRQIVGNAGSLDSNLRLLLERGPAIPQAVRVGIASIARGVTGDDEEAR